MEAQKQPTVGVAIIVYDEKGTIGDCIQSFADDVDQIVVITQNNTSEETIEVIKAASDKVEIHNFGDWIDDFAAKRNFSFSFIKTDWVLWVDSDDIVHNAPALREIAGMVAPEVGAVWFPYHYAIDEFGNPTTIYERERLLRMKVGWIWQGRLHETTSPLTECKHVRTDKVIFMHRHLAGKQDRNERNFKLLDIMHAENPDDKRVWLYYGHQHFATGNWMDAAQWYLKFGTDKGAIPIERYQALNYCSKAMRNMRDPQAVDVAMQALELYPAFKDSYMELCQAYHMLQDWDKSLHWAAMSDQKGLIIDPPAVIFLNPLEYSFNCRLTRADCWLKKGDLDRCMEQLQMAYGVRQDPGLLGHIQSIQSAMVRNRAIDGIRVLANDLHNSGEITKLGALRDATPYWYRDDNEYASLRASIDAYLEDMKDEPQVVPGKKNSVLVNIGNAVNPLALLAEMDKTYDKVKVVCPMPKADSNQLTVWAQRDFEDMIMASDDRHLVTLRREENSIVCEYDKRSPEGLRIRMFVGKGLEFWNPQTIASQGCGGSETSAAWLAKALAKKDCYPILYAMDNQVQDKVVYRLYTDYTPDSIPCDLFISSRTPEVFDSVIPASQKYLWVHDISCFDRLTPERAAELDAIIVLSQWHANFIKATYPWLKDAEVIDFDKNELTYNDDEVNAIYYADRECSKVPRIAIIGNGLDVQRFKGLKDRRVPHRFIWCSSPDRGLEELLNMWPKLKAELPDAELRIFYGWEYFDSSLMIPEQRARKERLKKLIRQEGVEWKGRIGQGQLARELMMADGMIYPPPHDFRETYGIAFLEAQAAGVVCFYRQNGALGETIGRRGIALPLDSSEDQVVKAVVSTLHNKKLCDRLRREGKAYAMARGWGVQADKILKLFEIIGGGMGGDEPH